MFHYEIVVRKAAGCVILSGEPQARSRRIQTRIKGGEGEASPWLSSPVPGTKVPEPAEGPPPHHLKVAMYTKA